jgi:hypothetical protein
MSRRLPLVAAAFAAASIVVAFAGMRPASAYITPTYAAYVAPGSMGRQAAEPTIGVHGNVVMIQAHTETLRVRNFRSGGLADWEDVSAPITSTTTLDPVLVTDRNTGRTFVSQLVGACSLLAFTDDDGENWNENPLGCGAGAMVDHQSMGGGSFAGGDLLGGIAYDDATYYCASLVITAECALSRDGGFTFGPAVPAYSTGFCVGGHGHLKVAPDGTVYLPHQYCNALQATLVSTDNGTTWTPRTIPGSASQQESDPAVDVDANGKAYACIQGNVAGNGVPQVSTTDANCNWTQVRTLSVTIKNIQFPAVVAGMGGRAACAFLGTTTAGDDQIAAFRGVWHLYVATTFDGGATWSVVDATPTDAVQRGPICLKGQTGCPSAARNLLDFIDVTIDDSGRVLVAYADGCTGACVSGSGASDSEVATIVRQSGGTLLCEQLGACR